MDDGHTQWWMSNQCLLIKRKSEISSNWFYQHCLTVINAYYTKVKFEENLAKFNMEFPREEVTVTRCDTYEMPGIYRSRTYSDAGDESEQVLQTFESNMCWYPFTQDWTTDTTWSSGCLEQEYCNVMNLSE